MATRTTDPVVQAPLVTEDERQRIFKRMERHQPELWRQLYPRVYEGPALADSYSAEDPAHFFLWQSYGARLLNPTEHSQNPLKTMAAGLMHLGMPHLWLTPAIVEGIKLTKPPRNLNWTRMALPFASMVMMLPRGAVVHPTEGDVRFIAYARVCYLAPDGNPEGVFSFVPYTRQYPALIEFSEETTAIVPFGKLPQRGLHPASPPGIDPAKDHAMQEEALHLLFNALLIATARPDLVKEPRLLRETPGEREVWSCRMLGEDYPIRHKP